ncbi:hypothetical protein C8A05DRAFT_42819 [Staphylotrichum tortipilum]|uniref:Uncharacterized protein n=1 Tax=Staphylotrichum tortipilum TaxID=2831512 RepID=A0AAN6MQD6_9PEZI|nr:hypothetical protein C8A05DRAFT_42819 [Staphylotrichum longicolle]
MRIIYIRRRFCHGRLALSLVCDINPQHPQALQVAESVVAPIRALPRSHLRECNIRLAKEADAGLQQIATDTVVHASRLPLFPSSPSKPPGANRATLASLPSELRIRILEYTDLSERPRLSDLLDNGFPSNDHVAQFFACWYGTSRCGGSPAIGCFCRRGHAAFSVACKCWVPPVATLFLLSRALCGDARFIFFSSNRFIVFDFRIQFPWELPGFDKCVEGGPIPRYRYPFGRLAASLFLRDMVPQSAVRHLRFLDLIFPPYLPPSWPDAQHPAMQEWWETVEWLRNKISAPALTLRLFVVFVVRRGDTNSPGYSATIAEDEVDTIMGDYTNLLQPATVRWQWLQMAQDALKEHAERYVMGSRYESLYADGRMEPEPDDWYEIFYAYW